MSFVFGFHSLILEKGLPFTPRLFATLRSLFRTREGGGLEGVEDLVRNVLEVSLDEGGDELGGKGFVREDVEQLHAILGRCRICRKARQERENEVVNDLEGHLDQLETRKLVDVDEGPVRDAVYVEVFQASPDVSGEVLHLFSESLGLSLIHI